jgi:hypothetical protein
MANTTDATAFYNWLSQQTAFPAIGQPPENFTVPGPIADAPRDHSTVTQLFTVQGGKLVPATAP